MLCVYCGSDLSKVIDKRSVKGSGEIRRRRECLKCRRRFTTYERISVTELYVIKRDGRRELFNPDKLRTGIERSLEKRPEFARVCEIAAKIESKLRSRGELEVSSKVIGLMVLSELKRIDKVAYLRFVSVYRKFSDPIDFTKELEVLH